MLFPVFSPTAGSLTPSIRATAVTAGSAAADPVSVNLPSGSVGDIMVMCLVVGTGAARTIQVPAGWSSAGDCAASGNLRDAQLLWRVADNTEGASVSISVTGGATAYAAVVARYATGNTFDSGGFSAPASTATPDPPSVLNTPGAANSLFTAAFVAAQDIGSVTVPSGYGGLVTAQSTVTAVRVACGMAFRTVPAALSEDPGAWNLGATLASAVASWSIH